MATQEQIFAAADELFGTIRLVPSISQVRAAINDGSDFTTIAAGMRAWASTRNRPGMLRPEVSND